MEDFLNDVHRRLMSEENGDWLVISGNEACDLDSTVCALSYAFFKHKKVGQNRTVIPLCYINRADMVLRTEVIYWLNQCQIDWQKLVFSDDLFGPNSKVLTNHVRLILVDHNATTGRISDAEWPLDEVIDHHQIEETDSSRFVDCSFRRIERVGSCASLVTSLILQSADARENMPVVIWKLLYGAILIDTIGVSDRGRIAGRLTDLDLLMASRIEDIIGDSLFAGGDRRSLFMQLESAKFDVKGLSTWDLLRRDAKLARNPNGSGECYVCSTVSGMDFQVLIKLSDFVGAACRICDHFSAQLLVCITVGYPPVEEQQRGVAALSRRRGLVIFSPSSGTGECAELGRFLSDPANGLKLIADPLTNDFVPFAGVIENEKVTRKAILPLLIRFLQRKQRSKPNPPVGSVAGENLETNDNHAKPSEDPTDSGGQLTSFSLCFGAFGTEFKSRFEHLRKWLASLTPEERINLVNASLLEAVRGDRSVRPRISECLPTNLMRKITEILLNKACAAVKREEKEADSRRRAVPESADSSMEITYVRKKSVDTKPKIILSGVGSVLNHGRRLTLPDSSRLQSLGLTGSSPSRDNGWRRSVDTHSLSGAENSKPSWLETEYLTRHPNWLAERIPDSSVDAVEGVSFRLYRRLSAMSRDNRPQSSSVDGPDFNTIDDAELALLRTSFADIQNVAAQTSESKSADTEMTTLSSCVSWPVAHPDDLVQRGLDWLRRSPQDQHLALSQKAKSSASPGEQPVNTQTNQPRCSVPSRVTFMLDIDQRGQTVCSPASPASSGAFAASSGDVEH